jgi:hypothetical protein
MNTQNAKGQKREYPFDIFDMLVGDWQFVDSPDAKDVWIYIRIPNGTPEGSLAHLPLVQGQAASWRWDGNREAPTLTPSILHDDGVGGAWHGYMTKGELVSC